MDSSREKLVSSELNRALTQRETEKAQLSQKKEPQIFELKVLRDFGLNENEGKEDLTPLNFRDHKDFNNFDDEFGGLDMLKLEDSFSQINQSSLLNAMQMFDRRSS